MAIEDIFKKVDKEIGFVEEEKRYLNHSLHDDYHDLLLKDRIHSYIIGQVGMGKTRLLWYLIDQDLKDPNRSIIIFDAKGGLYFDILAHLKGNLNFSDKELLERVILVDFDQPFHTPVINPLSFFSDTDQTLVDLNDPLLDPNFVALKINKIVGNAKEGIKSHFTESQWGARIEQTLNSALALAIYNNLSLADVVSIINPYNKQTDQLIKNLLTNPLIPDNLRFFWGNFIHLSPTRKMDFVSTTYTKIAPFLLSPVLRHGFCSKPTINLENEINSPGKIILVNLYLGSQIMDNESIKLLGAFVFNQIFNIAIARNEHSQQLVPLSIYADEFYKYCTDNFSDVVALLRSKAVNLTVAHQNVDQLQLERGNASAVLKSIIDECNIKSVFKIGASSASLLSKEIFFSEEGYQGGRLKRVSSNQQSDRLRKLQKQEVYVSSQSRNAVKIKVPDIHSPENKEKILHYLFNQVFVPPHYKYFISRQEAEDYIKKKNEGINEFFTSTENEININPNDINTPDKINPKELKSYNKDDLNNERDFDI